MLGIRVNSWLKALIVLFFLGTGLELVTTDAEARAGRGRSSGRSSSFNRQSTPPPQQRQAMPPNNTSPAGGGFMRGMAGGLAGGFLGSMLFSSMGQAAGAGGAAGGGGIGFLEIMLIAGLAYFGFRWWKGRQQAAAAFNGISQRHSMPSYNNSPELQQGTLDMGRFSSLAPAGGIEQDHASDLFFKIQGAWTRRDLTSAKDVIEPAMQEILDRDLIALKEAQRINRLENITVRRTEVTDSWQEAGRDYSTVRFTANLLDYEVDEKTGAVLSGSNTDPVKFEEDWTFSKAGPAGQWQLAGIQQV